MEKKDVFISYSRKDTVIADKICAAFDRAGITYFIDRQGIGGGMEFPIVLAKAIKECKLFLFLASANSYESKFTNSEITFAFNEKPKNSLLPYIIDGSNLPLEMRFIFSGINWRNTDDHPIDSILIDDVCRLLGKVKMPQYESKDNNVTNSKVFEEETPEELVNKAWFCEKNNEFTKAVELYRRAAELGHAGAQNNLGNCYFFGKGVSKDYTEALRWFRKAALQGDGFAQYNLGSCFYCGNGVSKDFTEAARWFQMAAEQGHVNAQSFLGILYRDGLGVSRDYYEAARWFRKAAEQGDVYAQESMGFCYYKGEGVTKDYAEASQWFRKAAMQGDADSQYNLGSCYYNGTGVVKDYEFAKKWFRKAAEQGNTDAKEALEKMETSERSAKPIGGNDPCPCGSGKKYKDCHGRVLK